jgi:oligopeptide/dipeptide ABC transporter ATP-binding protein
MDNNVLKVTGLKVIFPATGGLIKAVEGIDIEVEKGKCVALVGESGCGKSVTSLAIMRLLKTPPALVKIDEISFDGQNLLELSDSEMQSIRGRKLSMIFQDAMTSLNPVMQIGKQISEVFIQHKKMDKKKAKEASIETLKKVGVPSPEKVYSYFPHQLSGGMKQRVLIAMAFACKPSLIIADEPTTALDVTIQAQVLELLSDLQKSHNTSLMLITHDLSVVANMADIVYVMYSGKIVERGTIKQLFKNPLHPYTIGLLGSVPKLNEKYERFVQIPDSVPHPMFKPEGCYFHPRCNKATDICKTKMPVLRTFVDGRQIRCFNVCDSFDAEYKEENCDAKC